MAPFLRNLFAHSNFYQETFEKLQKKDDFEKEINARILYREKNIDIKSPLLVLFGMKYMGGGGTRFI